MYHWLARWDGIGYSHPFACGLWPTPPVPWHFRRETLWLSGKTEDVKIVSFGEMILFDNWLSVKLWSVGNYETTWPTRLFHGFTLSYDLHTAGFDRISIVSWQVFIYPQPFDSSDAVGFNSLTNQIVPHSFGTLLGQIFIEVFRTTMIGIAINPFVYGLLLIRIWFHSNNSTK